MANILVVDDDRNILDTFIDLFAEHVVEGNRDDAGHEVHHQQRDREGRRPQGQDQQPRRGAELWRQSGTAERIGTR